MDDNSKFLEENGIKLFQFSIEGNKVHYLASSWQQEPFVDINAEVMAKAVSVVLGIYTVVIMICVDKRNHPLLIHCNKGKVMTLYWLY